MIEHHKRDVANEIFQKRDVMFVVDKLGAAGKSSFCKFLSYHKMAHILGHGSPRDLMFEIIQSPPSLAYALLTYISKYLHTYRIRALIVALDFWPAIGIHVTKFL